MPFCPKCAGEVPVEAKFCMNCGATLSAAPASPATPSPPTIRPTQLDDFADLGSRIIAGIVDYIIVGIVAAILFFAIFTPWMMISRPRLGMMAGFGWGWFGGMFLIQFVLWLMYFSYFEGTSGQTIGKRIVHVKVTKEDGLRCDLGSALVRNILRIIDHLPFLYILGIILIAVTNKKQRLGDMLARTIVVKT
jgi:uncharacterized RDD family membrane protein YckC